MTSNAGESPQAPVPTAGPPGLLLRATLHRPITVLMGLLTLVVLGVIAYRGIPLQLVPPGFTFNSISVRVPVNDSTPEEVMELVAKPVEEMIRTIQGVTRVTSFSSRNACRVRVEYSSKADGDTIYGDLRDRMERLLPSMPEGADRYFIFRFNLETDLPVMMMAVSYTDAQRDPEMLLETLVQKRLEAVDGVAQVEMRGLIQRRVDIELDPALVEAYQIDVRKLIERLRADNLMGTGGLLREAGQRVLLRLAGRFDDFEELRQFRVNDSVLLGDIAKIDYRRALRDFVVRMDGKLCRVIEVSKESEANSLQVCEALRATVAELPNDPRLRDFTFNVFHDQGVLIESSLSELKQSCVWGGLLAIAVLYAFLRRIAITLVIAAAIPLSLLIAVILIYFQGGTFNFVSISGLTLGVGMLVDNAIVIAENIFRLRILGLNRRDAAAAGVREVALAITLATLTTMAVFLPLILLGGDSTIRLFMSELGLPVCYSVAASLGVGLVVIPIATTMVRWRIAGSTADGTPFEGPILGWCRGLTSRVLDWTLRHRMAATSLLCLMFFSSSPAYELLKWQGGAESRTSQVNLQIEMPPSFDLIDADTTVERIRQAFLPVARDERVENMVAWLNDRNGTLAFFFEPGVTVSEKAFIERLRPLVPEQAGVKVVFGREEDDERRQKEFRISAQGRDPRVLADIIDRVAILLRQMPGVLEVYSGRETSDDEVEVGIERERAQRYGISPQSVSNLVAWALRGAPLTDFETPDEEVPLWIRYRGSDMESLGELYRVPVYTPTGEPVPLANLGTFAVQRGLPTIMRRDGKVLDSLSVTTTESVNGRELQLHILRLLRSIDVPEGYDLVMSDFIARDEENFRDVLQAGALSFLLIFFLMGVLFESFLLPVAVITSVPFLFVGALWALCAFGESLDEMAYVGFILLIGVVVNNAIVLIDCVSRFRPQFSDRNQAIVAATAARLRPILMTALTTIVGLIPMLALPSKGEGIDYRPLAAVIFGGMASATMFTLVAVPLAYSVLDDMRGWFGRVARSVGRRRGVDGA
ncbi:MAG: efflux RND transporter permease subunit [Planctomycetota bacterium]